MITFFAALAMAGAVPAPAPDKVDCSQYRGVGYGIAYKSQIPRQGDTVTLVPIWVSNYGMPGAPVPDACVRDWKVEGEGAKLVRDKKTGEMRVVIAPDAPVRSKVIFRATVAGHETAGSLTVIGATEQVLAGRFGIAEQTGCFGPDLAEMQFGATGSYSYTRPEAMIETMTSGGGRYRWDAASGKLEFDYNEEGPFKPYQWGTAKWIGGRLVLDGVDPGGPMSSAEPIPGYPVCHIVLAGG